MAELDLFAGYPAPQRVVSPTIRTIKNRITASYRDQEFYDGARENGYGGMKDDGRWAPIAHGIRDHYRLTDGQSVLQVRAHKGYLCRELHDLGLKVTGCESSHYAIEEASYPLDFVKGTILPYEDGEFDLVIAANVVYTHNLEGAIQTLREIQRVSRTHAWVTFAAYENEDDIDGLMLMRYWVLLGTTILTKADWLEVMKHAGYTGDCRFDTAKFMNLVRG